jgi:TonB family protein
LPEPFAGIARACLVDRSTIPQISALLTPAEVPAILRKKRYAPVGVWVLLALVAIVVAGVIIMHSDTSTQAPVKPAEVAKTPEPQTPPPPEPKPEPKQVPKAAKPPEPEKKAQRTPEPKQLAAAPEPSTPVPASGITEQPLPEITDQARSTIRGKVKFTVRVDVGPSGTVTDARLDSSGASKYFADRTIAAVRQWKFEPVSINGSEVGQRWRVRFEFVKSGTKVQPQRISP